MITRIEGRADDYSLVFIPVGNDEFEALVPVDTVDGMYLLALWLYDDAGNSTYYTSVLMVADVTGIRFAWQDDRYYVDWLSGYSAVWDAGYRADWEVC